MQRLDVIPPCDCKEREIRSFRLKCGEKVTFCSSCDGLVIDPEAEVPEVHCVMCHEDGATQMIKFENVLRIPLCCKCVPTFISLMVGTEEEEEEEEEEEDPKIKQRRCKCPGCNC